MAGGPATRCWVATVSVFLTVGFSVKSGLYCSEGLK
jgi:hypothetical protein